MYEIETRIDCRRCGTVRKLFPCRVRGTKITEQEKLLRLENLGWVIRAGFWCKRCVDKDDAPGIATIDEMGLGRVMRERAVYDDPVRWFFLSALDAAREEMTTVAEFSRSTRGQRLMRVLGITDGQARTWRDRAILTKEYIESLGSVVGDW